jgi:tRNA dimethylallyltransferase
MMRIKPNTVLAITGPTASGKTALSLEIASMIGMQAEIISADSRQIFRGLDIGTAKPDMDEISRIRHHCIDICNPDETFNAGAFAKKAGAIIHELLSKNILPIIVGGSGLYVQALCEGFFEMPPDKSEAFLSARKEVQDFYESYGRDVLFEALREVDPKSCEDYPDKNPRRIMRALEFSKAMGLRFSEQKSLMMNIPEFDTCYVMIHHEREELYQRINDRCERMWEGTVKEAKEMLERGIPRNAQSLDTVGYAQAIACIYGEIDEKTAIGKMKQATRNYAKRQITWSKRIEGLHILKGYNQEMAKEAIALLTADA